MDPKWSGNPSANCRWAGSFGGALALQGDVAYKGARCFDAFNSPSQREDAYALANVRLSWTSRSDAWTFAVFTENVTGTQYRTAAFALALAFLGFGTEVWDRPRWPGGVLTHDTDAAFLTPWPPRAESTLR